MAKINRTQNATRNVFWGIAEKVIALLLLFITRTVMIKTLGAEYLGLNGLFTSVLQVLSISELGIGSAIVFSMYEPIARDDNNLLCALINSYKKIYYVIGTVILVAGLVFIPFVPKLVDGDVPSDINLYILYCMYLFDTVISYYLFAYKQAIFTAYQRNDLISKRSLFISSVGSVLQIALLLGFKNYYVYAIVIPLCTIVTNIVNAILANKIYPQIKCIGSVPEDMRGDIKKRITGLVYTKIYNVVFASVDTIVVSSFLGLIPLAIFNNYYYIQTAVLGVLIIFTNSITAGVGNKMVTDTPAENYKDFMNLTFANGWLTGWCAICMLCLYQHFMVCWVGESLLFPVGTMVLMVLYFYLPRVTTMTYTYREASGLWWEDRYRPLVLTIVNLALNLTFVRIIGVNGVIISTLVCTAVISVPWGTTVLFKKYFKVSPAKYFKRIILYIFITAVTGGVTFLVCELLPGKGWLFLCAKALICVTLPNTIMLVFMRKMPEFEFSYNLARNLIKGLRPARASQKECSRQHDPR